MLGITLPASRWARCHSQSLLSCAHSTGSADQQSSSPACQCSCTGDHSFRVYWDLPDGQSAADNWEAHIISRFGAGAVTHAFRTVNGYPEMIGSVNLAGPASLTVRVRGAFGGVQGVWSPGVLPRCTESR